MSVTIGLLGDVMLGRLVAERIASGEPPEQLFSPALRELTAQLDLVVANLECCLSDRGEPTRRIPGKPFFFRGPPSAVRALQALGVRVVGLANNHSLDFEELALSDTLAHLDAAGIAHAGAGRHERAARAAAVVAAGAARVAVVAVSDHPAAYGASAGSWGTAHARLQGGVPQWLAHELAAARRAADFVIAFPHWGPNMTTEPAPWQRSAAGELTAAGADLVAGHSAHVFHGLEWRAGRPVAYDLGDALDDYRVDPILRNDLGLLLLWRPAGAAPELEAVGLRLRLGATAPAADADADWIAARLRRACARLGSEVARTDVCRFAIAPG